MAQLKIDWEAWTRRDLAQKDIVRLILERYFAKGRLNGEPATRQGLRGALREAIHLPTTRVWRLRRQRAVERLGARLAATALDPSL